jgi:hypothetical protein
MTSLSKELLLPPAGKQSAVARKPPINGNKEGVFCNRRRAVRRVFICGAA